MCVALQDYDVKGEYIRTWVPELKNVSSNRIHEPWQMSKSEQQQFGVNIGQDYPAPLPASQLVRPHGSEVLGHQHHACVHLLLQCCSLPTCWSVTACFCCLCVRIYMACCGAGEFLDVPKDV